MNQRIIALFLLLAMVGCQQLDVNSTPHTAIGACQGEGDSGRLCLKVSRKDLVQVITASGAVFDQNGQYSFAFILSW